MTLPASVEAERSILGGILLNNEAYFEAGSELNADMFSLDSHRRIYRAITELASNGVTADIITVTEELRRTQQLEAVGGVVYVSDLTNGVPDRGSVKHYCNIVLDKFHLRSLINASNLAIAQALEGGKPFEVAGVLQDAVMEYESSAQRQSVIKLADFMPEALLKLQAEAGAGDVAGLTWGIPSLDEATGRMREQELWLIGALPNRGKTPLGMQALVSNAEQGVPGMMFSLEMSRWQLSRRLLAAHSSVSASQIRRPKFIGNNEWGNLASATDKLSSLPIWVDDASRLTLAELTARARLSIRRRGVKLIVVDYLMLIDAPGKELRHQATAIARTMKALAKTESVTVLLLSQFKRPSNINDKPNSSWYKESGDIEAEANGGVAIHRPIQDETFTGEDEIIITKQREGELGSLPVTLDKRRLVFVDRYEEAHE